MKKSTKTIFTIGSLLIVAGIVLSGISFVIGVVSPNSWVKGSQLVTTSKEYSFEEIKNIQIDATVHNISVIPTDKDVFSVRCTDFKNAETKQEVRNERLIINSTKGHFYFFSFFSVNKQPEIIIEVPKEFNGNIEAGCTTGAIEISDFEKINQLQIKATTGKILIENMQIKECVARATTGKIALNDVKTEESVNLSLSTGNALIENVTAETVLVKTTTGKIGANKIEAEDIELKTTTGKIDANIVGDEDDYQIKAEITTGKKNVPEGNKDATKKIKASATAGKINIDFTK